MAKAKSYPESKGFGKSSAWSSKAVIPDVEKVKRHAMVDVFEPPDPAKKPKLKPKAPKPDPSTKAQQVGSVTIEDFYAALGDRYPHHDIRSSEGKVAEVSVPGGMIFVDRKKAMGCDSVAELRAYIDSLEVR